MAREVRSWFDRATAWSPVLLLGGLAALTYWLDSQVQPVPPRHDGSTRHDPDLFAQAFRVQTLDREGRPLQLIAGKTARHFGDDMTTEFTEPLLAQTEAGKPAMRVTAAKAKLSGDRKDVYFTGNVRAVREAAPPATADGTPTGPIIVTTEYLHVTPDQELARTDKAVTIEEPRGIIHSIGLELDNKAKTLRLDAGVRGTLQPQALPQ